MTARIALLCVVLSLAVAVPAQAAYLTLPNPNVGQSISQLNGQVLGAPIQSVQGDPYDALGHALSDAAAVQPLTSCSTYLTAGLLATCVAG